MSILNVFIPDAERALIAVDAAGLEVGGECSEALELQKSAIHGTAVVAVRGSIDIFGLLSAGLSSERRLWSVDDIAACLAPRLAYATRQLADLRERQGRIIDQDFPDWMGETEIVVAGWSASLGRPRAVVATVDKNCVAQVSEEARGRAAPAAWSPESLPDVSSMRAMRTAAETQARLINANFPDISASGQLTVYEITRHNILVRFMELGA